MKVANETQYSTQDLRKFFLQGLKAMGAETNKVIRVVYSKRGAHWGYASYGDSCFQGRSILMSVPKGKLDLLDFARVFEHEVSHNLGLRHKEMSEEVRRCVQEVTWHEGLQVRWEERAPKPKLDHVARREEKARRMAVKWERKLGIARRMYRKWSAKVRYYERRKTAAGKVQ